MSSIKDQGLVSTKEHDFLTNDDKIRGQEFAIVSFVSPEAVLKSKEVFAFTSFVKSIATDIDGLLNGISERFVGDNTTVDAIRGIRDRHAYMWTSDDMQAEFNAFKRSNEHRIDTDFTEKEGVFQTSVRGIKIRGVYGSESEAVARIKALQVKDPLFDMYIAEVGCWCPWSPNPEDIERQEYAETQLNTLVKNYKENATERDVMYERRKQDIQTRVMEEKDAWQQKKDAEAAVAPSS